MVCAWKCYSIVWRHNVHITKTCYFLPCHWTEATLSKPDQGLQSIRFSQTKDEQGSLRAVGALGLMSITSKQLKSTVRRVKRIDVKAERDCLTNRLKMGGIPWELASRIGDEIRSVKQMSLLYASVEDTDCRDRLLVPLVADLCSVVKLGGTASGWSAAIHRVWFSALPDPTLANERFDQLRHLVEDHALLLDKLHSGLLPDPALDALLASQQLLDTELARTVSIELPAEHSDCFPSESEQQRSFFRLKVLDKPQIFPCIVMQTCAGPYFSSRLCLFLLEGADFVSRLQETFSGDAECVAVARKVSLKLKQDFGAVTSNDDATVLLIRGLDCALDKAAKKNGFRGETRVLGK